MTLHKYVSAFLLASYFLLVRTLISRDLYLNPNSAIMLSGRNLKVQKIWTEMKYNFNITSEHLSKTHPK